MGNDKISVIVSTYNAEKEIDICVNSILNQTHKNIELILVDNASPDTIPEIVDRYMAQDNRVIALHNKVNIGVGDGRNTGIDWVMGNSDSSYLFFLDADDWIHPECLSRLLSMIVNDGSDNAFTKHTYSSRFEGFTDLSESEYVTKCFDNAEEFWIKEVKHSAFGTGRVFKKELFSSVRFPKSGLDDERTTYKLVYQCKKISTMNFGLYYWFQNPKSYMNNISVDKLMDAILSTREPLDF